MSEAAPEVAAIGETVAEESQGGLSAADIVADPLSLVESEMEWVTTAYDTIVNFVIGYSFQVVGAVIVMIVGVMVANRVGRLVLSVQEKRNVDVTLRQFVASVVRLVILVGFAIISLEKVGVSVTPFIAAIGGLALGASFALQAPVSNYGAGLVIILTRPFKVGDTIRVLEQSGVVQDINLATTVLTNEDDEEIVIPNKHLVGEVLVNSFASRVVEGVVGVAYANDPQRAIDVVLAALLADADVTRTPVPQVGIQAFGDSAIEIAYRYWVPTNSYFEVQYRVNMAVWRAVADAGLSIPFPQRDVHLFDGRTAG